jgi:adenosylhomocysteine nucleosidase
VFDVLEGPAIGIVVALAAEERHCLALATNVEPVALSPFPTHRLTFGDTLCTIMRSGIGMVHAAAATQSLIAEHQPSIILNFGCAGAHRRDLLPGDVIIGNRCIYHAATQILPNGKERYVGFIDEQGADIAHVNRLHAVDCDIRLVERALTVVRRSPIEPWPDSRRVPIATVGAIASADVWTQSIDRLDAIHRQHKTLCEDMEAAAVGRIAQLYGLPFLAVKDISNNEFLRTSDLFDFTDFPVEEVGKRAAAVIAGLATVLGARDLVSC